MVHFAKYRSNLKETGSDWGQWIGRSDKTKIFDQTSGVPPEDKKENKKKMNAKNPEKPEKKSPEITNKSKFAFIMEGNRYTSLRCFIDLNLQLYLITRHHLGSFLSLSTSWITTRWEMSFIHPVALAWALIWPKNRKSILPVKGSCAGVLTNAVIWGQSFMALWVPNKTAL